MHYASKILAVVATAAVFSFASSANAQQPLFANQYTQGYANQATAQMYVAPVPVPQWVGHTYYTYQPLNPHEMMYKHSSRFHSYYDNGRGLNRTGVHYGYPPVRTAVHGLFKAFSLPRP